MRPSFFPRLVNGPFGDPALYVAHLHQRRALLFDAGELGGFSSRKLLKVSHVFVSHAHMDHFIGFDHLVRLMLGRPKRLCLYGPVPFIDQVISRLASYSWNLVGRYDERLVLDVKQLREGVLEGVVLDCRHGFQDPGTRDTEPSDGLICKEDTFQVRATVLDHLIHSMAFCLEEPVHIQILKGRLEPLGLTVGPWLRDFKGAVIRGESDETPIKVSPSQKGPMPLGWLKNRLVKISPGQRVAYVVDAGYGQTNHQRIVALVQGADLLFIEAAFLHEDAGRAKATSHLTAFQAGRLAAEAGVKRVIPFHFSPKYGSDGERIVSEVQEAFNGFAAQGP